MFFTFKENYYFCEDILLLLVSFCFFLLHLVTICNFLLFQKICLLFKVFESLCTHVHAPCSHVDASMATKVEARMCLRWKTPIMPGVDLVQDIGR
jgi:hypothetical protein